ncbi:hypothetical protein [Nitrosopumilus sp. S4]
MNKKTEQYEEIFNFLCDNIPEWEKVIIEGNPKIKTNQLNVEFKQMENILEKFNLRITDVSYTDYYGIIFGIEKINQI